MNPIDTAKEAVASAVSAAFDTLAEASVAAGEAFVDVLFVAVGALL